jgi:DtxR family transcriptional regulator, Mn-dependent transcriptional regulator
LHPEIPLIDMYTLAEENYLKEIYHLSDSGQSEVTTNAIAEKLKTTPASVTDMIKKLSQKGLVVYKKYQGVNISQAGKTHALKIIRKHRLWETFLVEKLNFTWDEVHEVAEQLEHIQSSLLVERLDKFLGYPEYDPHGEPIPSATGELKIKEKVYLADLEIGQKGKVMAVVDSNTNFLQYLDKIGVAIGDTVQVLEKISYDQSMLIKIDEKKDLYISRQVSENIYCVRV